MPASLRCPAGYVDCTGGELPLSVVALTAKFAGSAEGRKELRASLVRLTPLGSILTPGSRGLNISSMRVSAHAYGKPMWRRVARGPERLVPVGAGAGLHCPVPEEAAPPVLVSGVGDSGTRGLAMLVRDGFGYTFCPTTPGKGKQTATPGSLSGCNAAGDNPKFFHDTGAFPMAIFKGTANYSPADGPEAEVFSLFHGLCDGVLATTRSMVANGKGEPLARWGWKSPRALYYLPLFDVIFR